MVYNCVATNTWGCPAQATINKQGAVQGVFVRGGLRPRGLCEREETANKVDEAGSGKPDAEEDCDKLHEPDAVTRPQNVHVL